MTTDEAREAAWREHVRQIPLLSRMESKSLHVRVTKLGYEAGWGARGEYDKEQIAALRDALDRAIQLLEHGDFRNGVTDPTGTLDEGVVLAGGLIGELRALAGQSEEATG